MTYLPPTPLRLTLAGLATLTLLAAGCSGVEAQRRRDAFEAEGRTGHPEASFLVAFGEGPTRPEAESAARAAVAATVKSQISQKFSAYNEERAREGRIVAEQRIVNEVVSKVDTAFGAYFKAVKAQEVSGGWHALAVASRADLDAAIEAEAQRKLRAGDAAWRRIAEAKTWLAVAPGWCEAKAASDALDALDLQRQAVSGKRAWTAQRLERWAAASKRFAEAKAQTMTVVAGVAGTAETAQPSGPPIVAALHEAGWRAEQGAATCGGDVALVVEPKVDSSCRRSSLGVEVCKATLVLEGRNCSGGALFSERSAESQATHSNDTAAALRRAVSQIAVQPVVEKARVRLLAVLGEGCPVPK
jgi:hypothetical protein